MEFQENSAQKNKFYDLCATLEKTESEAHSTAGGSEHEILSVGFSAWQAEFKSMEALRTLFRSPYVCEQLFSALNYTKSDTSNG